MILLVVTGLAFGAQYVTPVETAANWQKTAQAFAAPGQNSLLLLRWRGVHRPVAISDGNAEMNLAQN